MAPCIVPDKKNTMVGVATCTIEDNKYQSHNFFTTHNCFFATIYSSVITSLHPDQNYLTKQMRHTDQDKFERLDPLAKQE